MIFVTSFTPSHCSSSLLHDLILFALLWLITFLHNSLFSDLSVDHLNIEHLLLLSFIIFKSWIPLWTRHEDLKCLNKMTMHLSMWFRQMWSSTAFSPSWTFSYQPMWCQKGCSRPKNLLLTFLLHTIELDVHQRSKEG